MTSPPPAAALDGFNALPEGELRAALSVCCASAEWVDRIVAARPYQDAGSLLESAEATVRTLSGRELAEALAAHPRIGDRAEGASAEAQLSRREQASVSDADDAVRQALHEGNLAYEARFDRVFLIRAAGRSPTEMLAELQRRLGNDPATEERETAEQLGQIARLRLEAWLSA